MMTIFVVVVMSSTQTGVYMQKTSVAFAILVPVNIT